MLIDFSVGFVVVVLCSKIAIYWDKNFAHPLVLLIMFFYQLICCTVTRLKVYLVIYCWNAIIVKNHSLSFHLGNLIKNWKIEVKVGSGSSIAVLFHAQIWTYTILWQNYYTRKFRTSTESVFSVSIHVLLLFLWLVNICLLYSIIIVCISEKRYICIQVNRRNKSLGNQNTCNFMI